jgi:HAD superfamily phosphatase
MKLLIFDIDSVLIDVSNSYNLAIKKTVEFFLGKVINIDIVNEFKNKPGLNNDWDCTEAILNEFDIYVKKKVIIKKFQEYYLGKDFNGLIKNEKLLLKQENIRLLSKKFNLAVFTGRPKEEAKFILKKFQIKQYFRLIIAMEDIKNQKPNPEGLNKIIERLDANKNNTAYIGDSVDDSIAAKNAGITFIGVIPPYANKEELTDVFKENNAEQILTNVNNIIKLN